MPGWSLVGSVLTVLRWSSSSDPDVRLLDCFSQLSEAYGPVSLH